MKQLNQKDIKIYRNRILKDQNGLCAICKQPPKRPTLDHHHIKRIKGTGLVRGVLDSNMNVFLAKIENNASRYGIKKEDLPTILRNVADYLEKDPYPYIHPSEKPKQKIITKQSFNKLIKKMKKSGYNKKYPVYRTTNNKNKQTLTIPLKKLFDNFNIEPEFYKT